MTPWRVAITRDESTDGPLTRALRDAGFTAVAWGTLAELEQHGRMPAAHTDA